MGVAACAQYLRPPHEQAAVFLSDDIGRVDRLPERRPTRAGIKFGIRVEQGGTTTGATVQPALVAVPIFPSKSPFRPFFAAYMILLRSKLHSPFLVGFF